MRRSVTIDTSHYAECSTLLMKFRKNHQRRLIVIAVMLIINFYLQTVVFATKYMGPSVQAVIYANDGKSVGLGMGIFAFVYLALFVGIGIFLYKQGVKWKILGIYLAVNGIIMTGYSIYRNIASAQGGTVSGVGVSHLAFGYGILTLLISLICIALAFLAEQTRPKVYAALIFLMILATLIGCFYWAIAAALMAIFLFAIPEYVKMQWIVQQPGYPYFNERFDEQQSNPDYEPLHKLDHRSYGEMADVTDPSAVPVYFKEKEKAHREEQRQVNEPKMDFTLKISNDPAEMPGIDEIFEKTEPLPEPEPPKAADIPDTRWDVPETKWDMPDTNWDVPEVNTDIPDLPDIPDIPVI